MDIPNTYEPISIEKLPNVKNLNELFSLDGPFRLSSFCRKFQNLTGYEGYLCRNITKAGLDPQTSGVKQHLGAWLVWPEKFAIMFEQSPKLHSSPVPDLDFKTILETAEGVFPFHGIMKKAGPSSALGGRQWVYNAWRNAGHPDDWGILKDPFFGSLYVTMPQFANQYISMVTITKGPSTLM